jgi:ribosomal protein S27E
MSQTLRCPSCGRTGVASLKAAAWGEHDIASTPDGFYISLAPDHSMHIVCNECRKAVYESSDGESTPQTPRLIRHLTQDSL